MSINSLLGTARLALTAHQAATQTIGNNIANATSEGYSRQRTVLQPHTSGGVLVTNIERVRDQLLDETYRRQLSQSSGFSVRSEGLSQLSSIFNEPSDDSLGAILDQFWNSWADLANSPTSTAAKSVVQQRGGQLANALNRYSSDLDALSASNISTLNGHITDFNRTTAQIADLNRQIIASESGGQTATTLRDTRDQLLDTLSKLAPVTVIEQPTGSTTVYLQGISIVDGVSSKKLELDSSGGELQITINDRRVDLATNSGVIGGKLAILNTDIPSAKAELDFLAQNLVTTINDMHRTGWSAAGEALGMSNWDPGSPPTGSNISFFNPANVSAATISLSSEVASSASFIAAGDIENAPGNNALAQQLSQFRHQSVILKNGSTTETVSFNEYYRDLVTRTGVKTNDIALSASIHTTITANAETRRISVSGVSIDEELIAMTIHQQAYSAAARVITTADSMAQTLLDMVR